MLRDFTFPPGPEGLGDGFAFVWDSEGDTTQQSTVFPGAWFLAQGVVDDILHPTHFIKISDKHRLTVGIGEVADFWLWQFDLREAAPVTEDLVTNLENVLGTIRGDGYRIALCWPFPKVDAVGDAVPVPLYIRGVTQVDLLQSSMLSSNNIKSLFLYP